MHVASDDRLRLACTQLLPSERQEDATALLDSSPAWFRQHGATVQRAMTDNGLACNGSACNGKLFAKACSTNGIARKRARRCTPKTSGKAERLTQGSIREWAYASPFASSAQRRDAAQPWLQDCNAPKPHSGLGGKSAVTRLRSSAPA